jgi:serine-type D-Ala-D-Ala carboxypeptidase/endopeptidase
MSRRPLALVKYWPRLLSVAVAFVVGALGSVQRGFAALPSADGRERSAAVPGLLADDDYIRSILQRRIDQERRGVGIAVGVLDTNGFRVVTWGQSGNPARPQVDGDTLFEIGSITKTFTATLLADMVKRGEVSLDTTLRECLPSRLRLPSPGSGDITLRQLATHSSGLPPMPELPAAEEARQALFLVLREFRHLVRRELGKEPSTKAVAWVHATREQTFSYLERSKVDPAEPHQPEYSNLGACVLGEALAQKAHQSYEALLAERVLLPLGMTNTCVCVPADWEPFFAAGHDEVLQPAPRLNIPDLPGAGAIGSTVNDMLTYLSANLDHKMQP